MEQTEKKEGKLKPRERMFCEFYFDGITACDAYVKAGYKCQPQTARANSSEKLTKANIKAYLLELAKKREKEREVERVRLLNEYANIAYFDPSKVIGISSHVDDKGITQFFVKVEKLGELPEDTRRCIKKLTEAANGITVEFYDRLSAMDALRKMNGFDRPAKHELTGKDGGPIESVTIYIPDNGRDESKTA